jgi:GH24 family phage-related lysozyme (muramidase)
VVEGLTITLSQAITYLISDAAIAAARLARVVNDAAIQALTSHEYAACVSFVFNLGPGDPRKPPWHIWGDLNSGNLADVPNQMMLFDKARVNGPKSPPVEIPGLVHRRMAEVALWKAPDVDAAVAIVQSAPVAAPPSSYTRDIPTPPTEVSAKPPWTSKTLAGLLGTLGIGSASQALSQAHDGLKWIHDQITPYVGESSVLQHLQGELVIGFLLLGSLTAFFAYRKTGHPGQ